MGGWRVSATHKPCVFKERLRRHKYFLSVDLGLDAFSSNKCSDP